MKNSIIYLCITFVLVSTLVSCKKYLDVKAQSNYVYISSANDLQLLLDSYTAMNSSYPVEQQISSDDYYVTDATLLSLASLPVDIGLYNWDKDAIRPFNAGITDWQAAYQKILTANLVLENVGRFRKEPNPSAQLNNIEGSALFYRAYNFWSVAQLYANGYNSAKAAQDPGIPLRVTSNINEVISRGTVQETYNQIVNDLKKALPLLPDTASVVSRPAKLAAYAMLSRVFLSMSDYPSALENATLALAINNRLMDYNQLSITSATPFTLFNKEDIFHVIVKSASILTPGTATGNYAKINTVLFNSYANQDLRKQIFFKANSGIDAGTYRFTGNYDQTTSTNFFSGLAVDELFLTRAECYARAGDVNSALADLNTLLKNRYVSTIASPYVPVTATNASEALTRILLERRKELVMRGLRWTDLRRLNLDAGTAVTLTRITNGVTYSLPPNDLRYTLLIPSGVISASTIAQNAR